MSNNLSLDSKNTWQLHSNFESHLVNFDSNSRLISKMWLLIKKMCIIASFITNFQLPDVFRRGAICPPHRRSVGLEPIGDRVNGTQCNLGTSSFTMSTSMLKSVEKLMILSLRLKLTVSYKKSIHAPYADSQVILTLFSHLILFSNNDLMSLARINSKKR